ncbi:ABC transporter permease [Corynebacterium lactis RW2-5]|uniref:ABC transporter permease n=2 Tax=Corynebacterium lactis TaxID=1231000 RepID=A0A0K2H187_9CORY|nr:ABC transporter permease [Corynebacterium lactis RW2-5]
MHVGKRMARWLAVLLCAALGSFIVMDLLPGDAATVIARTSDQARVDALRTDLGLDRPLLARLWDWFSGLFFFGDGGMLFSSHRTVWEASAVATRNSAYLVAVALPLLLCIGVGAGIFAGLAPSSWRDTITSFAAQSTLATPDFAITALLLAVFAGALRLAPAVSLVPPGGTPADNPEALIIPALAVAVIGGAWLQRLVRAAIVDARALPHVRAAELAGMHPVSVLRLHTLPAAAGQIAQACAGTIPYVVAGTVVVENVVGFPGIGTAVTRFVATRETVAVATLTTVFAAITVASFALADFLGRRR